MIKALKHTSRTPYKVFVVGTPKCGKSALMHRNLTRNFVKEYTATLGWDVYVHQVPIPQSNDRAELQVWCCGGAERLRALLQEQYTGIRGILLCFDMTSEQSFKDLRYWHNEVQRALPEAVEILVGTKSDLADEVVISEDDIKKQAARWVVPYCITSAKNGHGVDEVFTTLLSHLLELSTRTNEPTTVEGEGGSQSAGARQDNATS